MRIKLLSVLFITGAIFSSPVISGNTVGTITSINSGPIFSSSNLAFIKISPTNNGSVNSASCVTNSWKYSLKVDDAVGKATFSMILTAYTTGKTVTVYGFNTCNNFNGVEDINKIILQ